jgi:hypothetical protein
MSRAWIFLALAIPLIGHGAATNWPAEATYRDVIEARRQNRPAPKPPLVAVSRVVGRRAGEVLVETRYPLGGVTTNARKLHVIYRAAEIATNTHAQAAYIAALGRYTRALAKSMDAERDADNKDAQSLHRQAQRLNAQADKLTPKEKGKNGGGGGLLAAVAAAGGAAAYGLRKMAVRT